MVLRETTECVLRGLSVILELPIPLIGVVGYPFEFESGSLLMVEGIDTDWRESWQRKQRKLDCALYRLFSLRLAFGVSFRLFCFFRAHYALFLFNALLIKASFSSVSGPRPVHITSDVQPFATVLVTFR